MPRRERHRAAVAEIEVAQQPARGRRPRQHAKRRRVRHHQHVGGAFHLLHAEAAAGGEHRKHRAVRGVLGEHRGGDGAAALQRGERLARDQRLAAQDAVLVRKRQPDHFELLFLDDAAQAARRLLLLVRPQPVTLDKTQRVTPLLRRHCEARCDGLDPQSERSIESGCFATRPAMTVATSHHSAADRCRILSAISLGTGAAHGAPRRRFTSTSIQ